MRSYVIPSGLRLCKSLSVARTHSRIFSSSIQRAHYADMTAHAREEKEYRDSRRVEESTEGLHAWKQREPYRVHETNEDFPVRYEAECHCGRVKYQLSREKPLASKLCHCTDCQVQHAAPFQWAAIFHKSDINFVNGHHNLEWYDPGKKSIQHKLPCKVRCSFCHSPIMDEGRNMILLFPGLVKFKSDEDLKKWHYTDHMFYGRRVVDLKDGLPKWTGLNDSSDLIEDSPPEMVKELQEKRAKERAEDGEKGEKRKRED